MRVFISWSGDRSRKAAVALRGWLPQVLNAVDPYVSSEDIDKGQRWATELATELEASDFGIIVLTADNIDAPWVNFEAGALSKRLEGARVATFLLGLKPSDIGPGPLTQFQATQFEQADVQKLVLALNAQLPENDRRHEDQLKEAFDVWWTHLKTKLDEVLVSALGRNPESPPSRRTSEAILEELLDLVRTQHQLLATEAAARTDGHRRIERMEHELFRLVHLLLPRREPRHPGLSEEASAALRRYHRLGNALNDWVARGQAPPAADRVRAQETARQLKRMASQTLSPQVAQALESGAADLLRLLAALPDGPTTRAELLPTPPPGFADD